MIQRIKASALTEQTDHQTTVIQFTLAEPPDKNTTAPEGAVALRTR
ncbi:MAG: hypothetical protein QNL62_08885 [Gammaproteobacteria bacterium]|nr:hypothetical protein [Gammaproteobacteria bacterium]